MLNRNFFSLIIHLTSHLVEVYGIIPGKGENRIVCFVEELVLNDDKLPAH